MPLTEQTINIGANYKEINALAQLNDENSILSFYKKLLKIRKCNELGSVFVYGNFKSYMEEKKNVFIYTREYEDKKICVVTNMNKFIEKIQLPFELDKTLLSNYNNEYSSDLELNPYEAFVAVVK